MDKLNDEEAAMSHKTKLEKINSFCESHRCAVKRIIQYIIERLDELPAKVKTFIDLLWKSIKKFDDQTGKSVMVEAMKLFGKLLSLIGLAFPVAGLLSRVVLLVASFLKIFFSVSDLKVMLKPESISMIPESFRHGINGLAEKLERTAIFIDAVDDEEHVDDSTLNDLISNVDIHIGVREIGDLRSRILSLMSGKQEEWMTCLHFLTLFVKISTLRHILLFRMMTCLKMKKYSGTGTVKALQTYIKKERTDNHAFLAFFSMPTLENVGILTVFDPLVHTELATYVKEMGLNVQNLSTVLHNQVFLIQPFTDECIFLGRPLLSLSSVRSMSISTNINNDRIKFKFTALENTFNEFYIQTPDTGQYIYLKDDRYCKYRDFTIIPDCARWRMIFVRETDDNEDLLSRVIFCTKQWPDRFLYLDNTYFKRAKGLPTDREASTKCLFMLSPPGEKPLSIQMTCFERTVHDFPHTEQPETENRSPVPKLTGENAHLADIQAYLDKRQVKVEFVSNSERKPPENNNGLAYLEEIQVFLSMKKVRIDKDIEKIKKYILKDETFSLFTSLKKIAEIIRYLDEQHFTDNTMYGILDVFSINFYLFKDDFQFGSVLRQLLRICGVVLSCIWPLHNIESFVCSRLEQEDKSRLECLKDIHQLRTFAIYLHEIECTDNIKDSHITEIRSFCTDLNSIITLKERAKSDPRLIETTVKMSILQLSLLWQMYAVAKTPDHGHITASYFRGVIMTYKDDEFEFLEKLKECQLSMDTSEDMMLVNKYLACFECGSLKSSNLTNEQKLELMSLIVEPMLEEVHRKRIDMLKSNIDDQ